MRVFQTIQSTFPFTSEGPVEQPLGPSTDDMVSIMASVVSALSLENGRDPEWRDVTYKVVSIRIDMEA